MNTTDAVRDRILHLCEERDMTINRLATVSAAVQHQEHPLRQEPEPEAADHQNALRRAGHHPRRVFLHPGV